MEKKLDSIRKGTLRQKHKIEVIFIFIFHEASINSFSMKTNKLCHRYATLSKKKLVIIARFK